MGKLVIEDDCLAPRRWMHVHYEGPKPYEWCEQVKALMRPHFEVTSSKIFEPRWMWDYSTDPIHFYVVYKVRKDISRFTSIWYKFRVLGYKDKRRDWGNFSLEMHGIIEHEFEPYNRWLAPFWWAYRYMYYDRIVRRRTLEMCRDYINRFATLLKDKYGIGTVTES